MWFPSKEEVVLAGKEFITPIGPTSTKKPTVSRTLPFKKAKRLRVSWFVLGMLAGVGCAFALQAAISSFHSASDAGDMEETSALEGSGEEADISPSHFLIKVGKGDTLLDILTRKGVNFQEAHDIVDAVRAHYDPRNLTVGQEVDLQLNEEKIAGSDKDFDVASLVIETSVTQAVDFEQQSKGDFNVATHEAKLTTELSGGGGVITNSLYQTGIDQGVPPAVLSSLINAYSYDVDFQREIHRGDAFQVVFEELKTDKDKIAGYGKMLYATLKLGNEEKRIYHYTLRNGEEGYYDENGQSVRKALLRTPINGARLTSGYGMRRHPILGYTRMHKGVDFAAPTGTPVYAAGDGYIDYAARKGSYGIYVRVNHNTQYATAYAHLSKLGAKARRGSRVKQGDIIGYVGTTGASTGPHLHYEVLAYGKQTNPKNLKFPTGHKLEGQELAAFKDNVKQVQLVASRVIDHQPALASIATTTPHQD